MYPVDGFSVKAADVRSGQLVKFDEAASVQENNPIGVKLVFEIAPGGWTTPQSDLIGDYQDHPLSIKPATFIVTVNERYKDQGGQPLEVTLKLWAAKTKMTKTTVVYGCTDPNAVNYNRNATVNDNTCKYTGDGTDGTDDENTENTDVKI
jgi:hypothetical protein